MAERHSGEIADENMAGARAVLRQLQHDGHIETFELNGRAVFVRIRFQETPVENRAAVVCRRG